MKKADLFSYFRSVSLRLVFVCRTSTERIRQLLFRRRRSSFLYITSVHFRRPGEVRSNDTLCLSGIIYIPDLKKFLMLEVCKIFMLGKDI